MNLQTLQKMYVLAILKYEASCWKTTRTEIKVYQIQKFDNDSLTNPYKHPIRI